jgi:hypothetical protein
MYIVQYILYRMVGLEIKDGSCIIDGYRWILLLRAEAKFLVADWGI